MKCKNCPCNLAVPIVHDDECGWYEFYGTTWKDGEPGCTLKLKTLQKWKEMQEESLHLQGVTQGLEHDFVLHHFDMDQVIKQCEHMVGLDSTSKLKWKKGRRYYRAYRNYYCSNGPISEFDYMCEPAFELMETWKSKEYTYYSLTVLGLKWLGHQLHIIIELDD